VIREDYLMRLIRQVAQALARMVSRRAAADPAGALAAADAAYDALGVPREMCDVVDTPTLVETLRHPDKIRAMARLSWEEGHTYKAMGDPLTAFSRYRRALELFLEARAAGQEEDDDASILELSRLVPAEHLDPRYREAADP
jgi:hypothetical protein